MKRMMSPATTWTLLTLAFAGLTACEPALEDSTTVGVELESMARIHAPIINGDPPDAPYHDAVVSLHQVSGSSVSASPFCSGTLIAPTVVLTAAHCLDVANGGKPQFATMPPSALAIYVGDSPATDPSPSIFGVTQTLIHPGYDRKNLFNDIALVRLGAAVPTALTAPVAALPASLGLQGSDVGSLLLNFAGFGETETGSSGVKLQADGILGGLGCSVPGCYGADDPFTQFSYSQPDSGPCFGDSGGPAFIIRGGVPYVAGLTSWGDAYCTQFGVSTRVDAYGSFISGFVGGVDPGPDCSADSVCNTECGDSDPDCIDPGPDCSADGECNAECGDSDPDCSTSSPRCGDGVCGAGESCDGQAGTSSCAADCPGKVNGKKSTRFCYVEGLCTGPGCP